MARQNIPESGNEKTIQYAGLLGVDYQVDPTEVNRSRSPDMVNMISDLGGNPIKRYGYRKLGNAFSGEAIVSGVEWIVKKVAQGTDPETYRLHAVKIQTNEDGSTTELFDRELSERTNYGEIRKVFSNQVYLYVLCDYEWIKYETDRDEVHCIGLTEGLMYREVLSEMRAIIPDDEFIPTVMTMYKPNGKELVALPEGTTLAGVTEGVNILTPYRRVEYCVTTDTADELYFYIPACTAIVDDYRVEVLDSTTYEWKVVPHAKYTSEMKGIERDANDNFVYKVNARDPKGTGSIPVTVLQPYIYFNSVDVLPYVKVVTDNEPHLRFRDAQTVEVPAGVPNVRITYAPFSVTDVHTHDDPVHDYTEWVNSTSATETNPTLTYTIQGDLVTDSTRKTIIVRYTVSRTATFTVGTAATRTTSDGSIAYDGDKTFVYTRSASAQSYDERFISVRYPSRLMYQGFSSDLRTKIMAADVSIFFDTRLFVGTGVHTYYSRTSNPMKIDDNFYFDVDSDVVAYTPSSNKLAVIAKDTGQNTIYLAQGEYSETYGMPVYTVKASNASAGAVSRKVLGTLNDEPLFLSSTGIHGISTNYYSEKYAINRSAKINRRLCAEPDLENAVGVTFNGYFYLAINGHMYVLDGRHREVSRSGDNSYESYFFDNMPDIKNMYVINNRMLFDDGEFMYGWNDDMPEQYRYLDNLTPVEGIDGMYTGEPVKAKWCSVVDSDGAPQYYKTLSKKGTMVTIPQPMQTSCEITLIKDGLDEYYIGKFDGSTFPLGNIVLDSFTKKKVKKYKRLQFVVENNEPEPFGIVSIIKTFTIGNYAKR